MAFTLNGGKIILSFKYRPLWTLLIVKSLIDINSKFLRILFDFLGFTLV